ncbi:MAG: 30S ribosomal protein S20 [Planctomycetes bacterium]|nr:30S ribosomal protein S20 [Planctomycetota bacterium]
MAHSKQALKRHRQSEKNRLANKARMSTLKTTMKAVMAAVQTGDKAKAATLAVKACKSIDKAAENNTIHANKAARHKSQVMRAVGAMK